MPPVDVNPVLPPESGQTDQPDRPVAARSERATFPRTWLQDRIPRALAVSGPAIVILIAGAAGMSAYRASLQSAKWVAQSREVLLHTQHVVTDLINAETSQRGFLLTGEDRYLEPYTRSLSALKSDTADVRRMTRDNPVQQARLDTLTGVIAARLSALDSILDVRRSQGFLPAVERFRISRGKMLMDSARGIIARMDSDERQLLAARMEEDNRAARRVAVTLGISAIVAALLTLVANTFVAGLVTRIAENEESIEKQNAVLRQQATELEERNKRLQEQAAGLEQQREQLTNVSQQREDLLQSETALRLRTEKLQSLAASLSAARSRVDIARLTLESGRDAIGLSQGLVHLIDDSTHPETLLLVYAIGYTAESLERWRRIPITSDTPAGDAVLRRVPIVVSHKADIRTRYPDLQAMLEGEKYAGSVVFPLILPPHGNQPSEVIGFVGYRFHSERDLDSAEYAFLHALAQLCAQAMERARLDEAEQTARRDAEQANRAKSNFLATMSHELRTPLNAIAGYAQLLEMGVRGPVTDEQRADLERIRRSQHHLLSMVEEILSFARIETGRAEYRIGDVPLSAVLEDVSAVAWPLAKRKGLKFNAPSSTDHIAVKADRDKLRQILVNLIGNAIKFTPENGELSISTAEDDGVVHISVSDTGPGIPQEHHASIFEPFVQLGRSLSSPADGTGLGLTISREYARAMGGEVSVRSEAEGGSVFTVTLARAVMNSD